MKRKPEGIRSLNVTVPIGAAVTMGRKGQRGGVTEKGQFHFVSPYEDSDKVRPYLPAFAPYHRLEPKHRRFLRANLVYGTIAQNFTNRLRMRVFPRHEEEPRARPNMSPVCEGDGEVALRWQRNEDEFREIVCPDAQCQYRQMDPPLCLPYSEILFRPRWEGMSLPSPVCSLKSETAWTSAANIAGFFKQLKDQADELLIENPTFYGFPFTIQLVEKTKPEKRRQWWSIVITPEADIVDFLLRQREQIRALQEPLKLLDEPELRDRENLPLIESEVLNKGESYEGN